MIVFSARAMPSSPGHPLAAHGFPGCKNSPTVISLKQGSRATPAPCPRNSFEKSFTSSVKFLKIYRLSPRLSLSSLRSISSNFKRTLLLAKILSCSSVASFALDDLFSPAQTSPSLTCASSPLAMLVPSFSPLSSHPLCLPSLSLPLSTLFLLPITRYLV